MTELLEAEAVRCIVCSGAGKIRQVLAAKTVGEQVYVLQEMHPCKGCGGFGIQLKFLDPRESRRRKNKKGGS